MIATTRITATAVPWPMLEFLYISVYIRLAITSVLKLPPVITYTISKTFSVLMTMVVMTTTMVGMMTGTITRQNTAHSVAPSMRAASMISSGTDLMEADRIVMQKPVQIQIPTRMIITVFMGTVSIHATGGKFK